MKTKFKMELLNSEELNHIKGGADLNGVISVANVNVAGLTAIAAKCNKKGDVIACANDKLVACAESVLKCPAGFSSDCDDSKFTISGCMPSFRIII